MNIDAYVKVNDILWKTRNKVTDIKEGDIREDGEKCERK